MKATLRRFSSSFNTVRISRHVRIWSNADEGRHLANQTTRENRLRRKAQHWQPVRHRQTWGHYGPQRMALRLRRKDSGAPQARDNAVDEEARQMLTLQLQPMPQLPTVRIRPMAARVGEPVHELLIGS